jgi:hypothetical protein
VQLRGFFSISSFTTLPLTLSRVEGLNNDALAIAVDFIRDAPNYGHMAA